MMKIRPGTLLGTCRFPDTKVTLACTELQADRSHILAATDLRLLQPWWARSVPVLGDVMFRCVCHDVSGEHGPLTHSPCRDLTPRICVIVIVPPGYLGDAGDDVAQPICGIRVPPGHQTRRSLAGVAYRRTRR